MSETMTSVPGMVKAKRVGVKPTIAVNIKPPEYALDPSGGENHTYKCVYVTAGGKQIKVKCTPAVWRKCEGKSGDGRVRDGLCFKTNTEFIIWSDGNGTVTDVDVLPGDYYQARQVAPADIIDNEALELLVNQGTGAIEVKKICLGVTRARIERLIGELNKLDKLSPGDSIPGGFEILSVSGNRVSISVSVKG